MFNETLSNQLSYHAPLAVAFGAPCFMVLLCVYALRRSGGHNGTKEHALLVVSLLGFVVAAGGLGVMMML